ncbi:MAG TPA: hypothetical protein VLD86_07245 [Ilumatobacteraceae bacterium]|nr:hypothetical protein [Ilumatobacteraceae bacterium]
MLPSDEMVVFVVDFAVVGGASSGVVDPVLAASVVAVSAGDPVPAGTDEAVAEPDAVSRLDSSLPHATRTTIDNNRPTIGDFPRTCILRPPGST